MLLSDNIEINYRPVYTNLINLSEQEWTRMVKLFIDKLAEKPIGKCLTDKLLRFIRTGYQIKIQNHDFPHNRTVFPKIRYVNHRTVLIVVPSIPYFTTIDTVESELCEDVDDKFFSNVSKVVSFKPAKCALDFDNYKYLLSQEKQTGFIGLAHELIHCLRNWEGMDSDDPEEEDNTIYGISGSVLMYNSSQYDKIYITENTIRKEWGMKARVSHDSKEIFCMGDRTTYVNSHLFTKDNYFDLV